MRSQLLVLALLLPGCRSGARDAKPGSGSAKGADESASGRYEAHSALTRARRFRVTWRPVPAPIPVNEPFELEVIVERPGDGRRVEDATISVSGWMPEHGHGMVRMPRSEEVEPGVYRVHGMLLHMPGTWQLVIDVIHENVAESAQFDLELAPLPAPFTSDEVRRILALSPLPDPPPDPTNAVYESDAAALLGQALFFDPRLSKDGRTSCASCHDPDTGWGDGLPLAEGVTQLERQAMTLWNVAYNRWFFWDGRADTLWSQALVPLENPFEHATSRLQVAHVLHDDPELRRAYEALFGPLPPLDDARRFPPEGRPVPDERDLHLKLHKVTRLSDANVREEGGGHVEAPFLHPHQRAWDGMSADDRAAVTRVFANAGKAIAAFERRIVSRRAPFDVFVEGLREGDEAKMAALGPAARRGLAVFLTRAHCHACHTGPELTDREFHDIRVLPRADLPPDPGRQRGIEIARKSPFQAGGQHSDAPESEVGQKVSYLPWHVHEEAEFKTPTLRNVAVTAPYMHQGQFATLEEVVRYYSTLEGAAESSTTETILVPIDLDDGEIADLVAFLESLTDVSIDPAYTRPPESPVYE